MEQSLQELQSALDTANAEVKRLSNQLLLAEEQRSHFLSNVLNEINNPITSILGLSRNIIHSAYDNPELVYKQANLTYQEIFDLDFKMRNIFSAAAIEAGTVTVRPVKVNIANVLDGIVHDLQFKLKKKELKLNLDVKLDAELFATDSSLVYSIFINLISNAIEFSKSNSQIQVKLTRANSAFVFSVKDQGNGIHPDDYAAMFKRFKQLDEGTTKPHPGTGLGLSIVKEYVDLLEGKISVESQLNQGTLFQVIIPEFNLPKDTEIEDELFYGQEEIF